MPTALDLAAAFWTADLECQTANERVWATGRDPDDNDPDVLRSVELDTRCGQLLEQLGELAEPWARDQLSRLDSLIDTATRMRKTRVLDGLHAAAFMRVFRSEFVLADAESLQPGGELPAVGVYAEDD